MSDERLQEHLRELSSLAARCAEELSEGIEAAARIMSNAVSSGGTLFFCGNGGSAADAQHLAAEYVIRFRLERRGVRAVSLNSDTAVLTAAANDYDYSIAFSRQLETLGRPGDVLVIHSTSGRSPSVLEAARAARRLGIGTIALTAKGGGELSGIVDHSVIVPTDNTSRAQEIHMCIQHAIGERIDRELGVEEWWQP